MLRLDDSFVWDSWIADDGDLYHLYFLKAPRSLGSPGLRHTNATVGHATSRDLVDWDYLGETFGPSPQGQGAFDDLGIWTGSVVRDGTVRGSPPRRCSRLSERVSPRAQRASSWAGRASDGGSQGPQSAIARGRRRNVGRRGEQLAAMREGRAVAAVTGAPLHLSLVDSVPGA
jgi:hypothetical protein